jgi:hypothetical protein
MANPRQYQKEEKRFCTWKLNLKLPTVTTPQSSYNWLNTTEGKQVLAIT